MLTKYKWIKPVIVACIIIPVGLFIYKTDFNQVFFELSKIGFRFMYILLSTFAAYLLGTLAWWVCLGKERKRIGILSLFMVRQIGETVGLYNPSSIVGGDLLKDQLLKPYHISRQASAESIVVSRITVVLSQLLLFITAGIWLLYQGFTKLPYYASVLLMLIITVLFVVHIVALRLLNRRSASAEAEINNSTSLWRKILHKAKKLVAEAKSFYQEKPTLFWTSYALSLFHWIVGSLEFYFILRFLGYDIAIMHGVLLDMGVIIVKSCGAFIPGQLGIEELGNKLVLAAIGIQAVSVWLAVSILRRTRQLFWILIGFICYIFVRKTITLNLVNHGSSVR